MAIVTINDSILNDIGDAIRGKNGSSNAYKPSEMAAAINAISAGDDTLLACCNKTITSYSSDAVTQVGDKIFSGCNKLVSISLPNATTIGQYTFDGCIALLNVSLPSVTTIDQSAFYNCKFTTLSLPSLITVGTSAFSQCRLLTKIFLPNVTEIKSQAFRYCDSLEAIVLNKSDTVATLGSNAFVYSGIAAGTGYIYVPSALVDSYKAATNWSTYADQIRAIEDYPDITGG